MNQFHKLFRWAWSVLVVCTLAFAMGGCEGSDGATGPAGPAGATGPTGPAGPSGQDLTPDLIQAAIDNSDPESCSTCHEAVGEMHQAVYDEYTDASDYVLTITSASYAAGDLTLNFSIDYMGAPLIDPAGAAPSVDSIGFYVVDWDSGAGTFANSVGGFYAALDASLAQSNGDGTYTLVQTLASDPTAAAAGAIVGKIGNDKLHIEADQNGTRTFPDLSGGPLSVTKRVSMYADLSTDAILFGNMDTNVATANVAGCAKCHGTPYRKHGNYEAKLAVDEPEFLVCRACHTDDASGGHEDWQYMVDDPFGWATGVAATADYAYSRTLMNDVHMSHAMEFPYPQSMSNCATCHEGKLAQILDDDNFTIETCKSCHVVDGVNTWPAAAGNTPEGDYAQDRRAPPLTYLWTSSDFGDVSGFHNPGLDCTVCHDGANASTFATYHSGYDKTIYDANGARYAATNTVAVDNVTIAGDSITVDFSATNVGISPTLAISFYGWDSKHFLVAGHDRDGNGIDCPHSSRPGCNIEWSPGSTKPFFTEEAGSVAGDWSVTFDMAGYQAYKTDPIPQLIADGKVKFAEISILPTLDVNGEPVLLDAVSTTFDLGGSLIVDDYFQGTGATVAMEKCDACHDNITRLAHFDRGRAGDSMQVCKACHATTFPGSHMEMQSRSIDSYVHAIHSFQPFDEGDIGADPVDQARNALHKTHTFPYFTALACEGCHVEGTVTYNVPDQSESMPGVIAASDSGAIPEYVTGPASRACGSCHRADLIVYDDVGGIVSFNAHTDAFGTLEENDSDDMVLFGIIDKIMSLFE